MKNKVDKFFDIAEKLFLATMLVLIPLMTGRNIDSGSVSEIGAMTVISITEIPILYILIKNTAEKNTVEKEKMDNDRRKEKSE